MKIRKLEKQHAAMSSVEGLRMCRHFRQAVLRQNDMRVRLPFVYEEQTTA